MKKEVRRELMMLVGGNLEAGLSASATKPRRATARPS